MWARRESGAKKAILFIEPGKGEGQLTDQWTQYTCTYRHPSDAKQIGTGMYIGILGGPVAVDDVSVVQGKAEPEVPVELKADRTRLKMLPARRDWRVVEGEPVWQHRAAISVSDVMGVPARGALVEIEIRNIFPGQFNYKHFTRNRLKVVDASSGGEQVPWTLVNSREKNERWARISGQFSIVFFASIPARSTKTYYVYVADRADEKAEVTWQDELPADLSDKVSYSYKLDWLRTGWEKRLDVSCRENGGIVAVHVRGWTSRKVWGELISPDCQVKLALPLVPDRADPSLWGCRDGFRLPAGSSDGIWKLEAKFETASGATEKEITSFAHGSTLW